MEDGEKMFYQSQIQILTEQLQSLKAQCAEQEQLNRDQVSQLWTLEENVRDLKECAQYVMEEGDKEVKMLQERLELQKQRQGQLEGQKQERCALKLQLDQELQDRKQELEAEEERMLASLRKERRQEVEELERLKLVKDAQLRELNSQYDQLRAAAMIRKEKKNAEIISAITTVQKERAEHHQTREEMAEHHQTREEVQTMMDKNVDLSRDNEHLRKQEIKLQDKIDNIKKAIGAEEVKMKPLLQKKEKLTKKCQLLEAKIQSFRPAHKLSAEMEALREQVEAEQHHLETCEDEVNQLQAELQRETSIRQRLENDVRDVVFSLRRLLKKDSATPFDTEEMQRLLKILQGPGSGSEEGNRGPELIDGLQPDRIQSPDFSTDPLFLLAKYRTGDLGFVPRPTWKPKTTKSRLLGRRTKK